jgi:GWxTD domain-containing protein
MKFKVPNRLNTLMTAMMKYLFPLLILFSSISSAQLGEEMPKSGSRPFSPIVFEAIPYWSEDTASCDLVVLYRVSSSFFFFAKTGTAQQEYYEAKGELVVEILNDKDITVARDYMSLHSERNTMSVKNNSLSDEVQGMFIFKLSKGLYRIVIEAKDGESGKSFINRDMKVDIQTNPPSGLNISPAIFAESTSQQNFIPMNRGGDVIIGQEGGCLFQAILPDTIIDIHISWKVQSKNEDDEENPQELNGDNCIQQMGTVAVHEESKSIIYKIAKGTAHSRVIFVSIPIKKLETGRYQLTLKVDQDTLKSFKEFTFNVVWPLQPRSLLDFKLAVDALKHIATEKEIDQITTSSSGKSRKAFRDFWQKRNPDTTNAFNPAMAEYYRRADEAIARFSTSNETDGYRTDRGRIFILFGSPSMINRLLKPNKPPTEIWTYEKLKQRFTFTDQNKSGNYILIKTENY